MNTRIKFLMCFVLVLLVSFSLVFAQGNKAQLEEHIKNISRRTEGLVGVAIKHLESGEELYVNGDVFFPMASVFKIPIFTEVLFQVKEGKFSLDDEIEIQKADQHLGSGYISSLYVPGIKLSVKNLIMFMMMISDNSATDILLTKVGADNVNDRLRSIGIEDITVSRTCQHLIMDFIGVDYDTYKDCTLYELSEVFEKMDRDERDREYAREKFNSELKDVSTPRAMNDLLKKIFTKQILDEESCDFMISVMLRCDTGGDRIKGMLPPGTKVAHKTGTIGGTVNDVGIIYLPDDLGHIAITVFTKETKAKQKEVAGVIAKIAQLAYDYFIFTVH